jgi:hypothetical protein
MWSVGSMTEASSGSDDGSEKEKYPPAVRKAIYWLGAATALLIALTALTKAGQEFYGSIASIFVANPKTCNGDMPYDEKVKCENQLR